MLLGYCLEGHLFIVCDVVGYVGPLSQAVVGEIFDALAVVH